RFGDDKRKRFATDINIDLRVEVRVGCINITQRYRFGQGGRWNTGGDNTHGLAIYQDVGAASSYTPVITGHTDEDLPWGLFAQRFQVGATNVVFLFLICLDATYAVIKRLAFGRQLITVE